MAGKVITMNLGGKNYKLVLGMDEVARIEDRFDRAFQEIFKKEQLGVRVVLFALWVMITREEPTLIYEKLVSMIEADMDAGKLELGDLASKVAEAVAESGVFRGKAKSPETPA